MAERRLEQLTEIETAIWAELCTAVRDKAHPWRLGVLATTDGHEADARTVVLREIDAGRPSSILERAGGKREAVSPKIICEAAEAGELPQAHPQEGGATGPPDPRSTPRSFRPPTTPSPPPLP